VLSYVSAQLCVSAYSHAMVVSHVRGVAVCNYICNYMRNGVLHVTPDFHTTSVLHAKYVFHVKYIFHVIYALQCFNQS